MHKLLCSTEHMQNYSTKLTTQVVTPHNHFISDSGKDMSMEDANNSVLTSTGLKAMQVDLLQFYNKLQDLYR